MANSKDSAENYIDIIKRKAPEYLDLLTADSEDDFLVAFDRVLEKAIEALEVNKKNYESLGENGLSGVLAGVLSIPGLTVTREPHRNGHVDLTIEADHCVPARKMLGEAKIYNGPKYHINGLQQLLNRYTTGRESRGLIIIYVRKENIADKINKIRDRMDSDLPMEQKGKTADHTLKWSFLSTHTHDCGEDLNVGHIGCNLYISQLVNK